MPQISLYVDNDTMQRVTRAARGEKKSISRWVRERVVREAGGAWPAEYAERVIGSLRGVDLDPPRSLSRRHNAPRELL